MGCRERGKVQPIDKNDLFLYNDKSSVTCPIYSAMNIWSWLLLQQSKLFVSIFYYFPLVPDLYIEAVNYVLSVWLHTTLSNIRQNKKQARHSIGVYHQFRMELDVTFFLNLKLFCYNFSCICCHFAFSTFHSI